jgi:hypothetical protein
MLSTFGIDMVIHFLKDKPCGFLQYKSSFQNKFRLHAVHSENALRFIARDVFFLCLIASFQSIEINPHAHEHG